MQYQKVTLCINTLYILLNFDLMFKGKNLKNVSGYY